jgi:hypothetical protein
MFEPTAYVIHGLPKDFELILNSKNISSDSVAENFENLPYDENSI